MKVSFIDRTSEARAHQHSIGVWLRRRSDEAKAEVLVITGQLADLAAAAVAEATKALQHKARRRQVRRMLEDLAVLVERTQRVIDQARCRVNGDQPAGATRLVSLHEPDARPIRKGRLGKPVEFGYKAQVVDNADGLIIDHSVHIGNPSDTELLRPAIERIATHLGVDADDWSPPIAATGTRRSKSDLAAAGVTTVVIPRTGKASAARARIEHADDFVDTVKWRTGMRRTHLAPQTRLGVATHPTARPRRRPHLVRPRRVRPQPRQAHPTAAMSPPPAPAAHRAPTSPTHAPLSRHLQPALSAPSDKNPPTTPSRHRSSCKENPLDPSGDFGEGDAVAEVVELADEVVASFVGVGAAGEPVAAEVVVVAVVGEQVPADDEDRVADGDGGFACGRCAGGAASTGRRGRCRGCATAATAHWLRISPSHRLPWLVLPGSAFAAGDVVPRAHPGPRGEVRGGREAGHVDADLGDDALGGPFADPGDGVEPVTGLD